MSYKARQSVDVQSEFVLYYPCSPSPSPTTCHYLGSSNGFLLGGRVEGWLEEGVGVSQIYSKKHVRRDAGGFKNKVQWKFLIGL
jgi:hypothetical protein